MNQLTLSKADNLDEILTIGLGGEVFALPASLVREILDICPMTPVPTAPSFVAHLINVRGRVVPLADLKLRFGLPKSEVTDDSRIVVLQVDIEGEPTVVAILADKVFEVTKLDSWVSEHVPQIGMRWRPEFVRAIGRRGDDFVMVLDIARVFVEPDVDQPIEALA